jgi:hypothetical protein
MVREKLRYTGDYSIKKKAIHHYGNYLCSFLKEGKERMVPPTIREKEIISSVPVSHRDVSAGTC